MIHYIITSSDGPTKIPYIRSLYIEIHCAIIAYENEKVKSAYYLAQ